MFMTGNLEAVAVVGLTHGFQPGRHALGVTVDTAGADF
jgi:hypothetical protein